MHHLHLFSICITTSIQRTISHYVDVDLWIPAIRRSSTCIGDYTFDKSPNAKNWGEASINEFMQLGYYEGYGLGWPGRELNRIERSPVPYGCWFEPRTSYPQNYVQFVNIGSNPLISHEAAIYTALQLTNRGGCLEREGYCVDKYWCYQALKLGYTAIIRHVVYSIEMVVCTGGCGTVKFNGSCPPTELRQGFRASELCDCGGASNKSVIDCPSKGKDYVSCNGGNVNILKTPPLTKLSISTDKCILEDLTMKSDAVERHDLNLTIVLASNMIMGFFRSNHKIHHYTNSWVEALEQEHSNVSVILDFEQHANLQMFGYDRADRLSHPSHRSISIVDEVLLQQNRLQIVGLNSFNLKHYGYSIQFDDFFYQVDDIANNIGQPKRTRKSSHTKLYTNIEGFRYASSFRVRDIMIGVITVENRLLKESIFDWHDLIEWIEKETKCLQKLGAKIVLLLTDLVRISALKVMRAIPFGIDLILSVHDDGEDDDYELCNLHCDYRNVQDRIVIIEPSNHQSAVSTAAFIKIHAFNLTAPDRLSYTAALVVQNISLYGSHQ